MRSPWQRGITALSYFLAPAVLTYQAQGQNRPPSLAAAKQLESEHSRGQRRANVDEIVVVGRRSRIQLEPPTSTISTQQLRQIGVKTVGEVAEKLRLQLAGGNTTPNSPIITLLNGKRISGQAAIADIPVGAILRVDVLASTAAEVYGYPSPQQIIDIVLRDKYQSREFTATTNIARETGTVEGKGDYSQFKLIGSDRLSLRVTQEFREPLIDRSQFLKDTGFTTRRNSTNGSINGATNLGILLLTSGLTFSKDSDFLPTLCLECDGVSKTVPRQSRDQASFTIGGDVENGNWTFHNDLAANIDNTTLIIDGMEQSRSKSSYVLSNTIITGSVKDLLENDLVFSIKENSRYTRIASNLSGLGPSVVSGSLHTGTVTTSTALLANKTKFPKLYAHLTIGAIKSSGSPLSYNTSGGLKLRLSPLLSLEARYVKERTPPTTMQIGDPTAIRTGYSILDLRNGTDTLVTLVSGGNPSLQPEIRESFNLSATAVLSPRREIAISAVVQREMTQGAIAFPNLITSLLEEQFPDRFVRNSAGKLVSVDGRYLNLPAASIWTASGTLTAPILRPDRPTATRLDLAVELRSFFNRTGADINQNYRPFDGNININGSKGRIGATAQIDYSAPYTLRSDIQRASFSSSITTSFSAFIDPRITSETSRSPRIEITVHNLFNKYRILDSRLAQSKDTSRRIAQVDLPFSASVAVLMPF